MPPLRRSPGRRTYSPPVLGAAHDTRATREPGGNRQLPTAYYLHVKRNIAWIVAYLAIYAIALALLARYETFDIEEPLMTLVLAGGGFTLVAWLITRRVDPLDTPRVPALAHVVAYMLLIAAYLTYGKWINAPVKILVFVLIPALLFRVLPKLRFNRKDALIVLVMSIVLTLFQLAFGNGPKRILEAGLGGWRLAARSRTHRIPRLAHDRSRRRRRVLLPRPPANAPRAIDALDRRRHPPRRPPLRAHPLPRPLPPHRRHRRVVHARIAADGGRLSDRDPLRRRHFSRRALGADAQFPRHRHHPRRRRPHPQRGSDRENIGFLGVRWQSHRFGMLESARPKTRRPGLTA